MSSVDQRVVEMQFKNSAFAKGIADTLSALQKLKDNLKLDGASKGAQEAARGLDDLGNRTGGLGQRFTALQAVAFGALASIGSKAVQVGSQLISALTIDPIKTGLQEYETNMNSIQTILANTQVSGAGLPEVNAALDELNHYSDQTIYNFSEMARNIGTFTAAGVNLDRSTQSIKGIANLAALSGSNSQQAAGAMYQLSQAISSGRVSLMDWNSVVNAGMGGTVFQRALAQTAQKMGTLSEGSVKLTGDMQNVSIAGKSFRDSIDATNGPSWLTSDVLTTTLSQFTGDLTDAELAAQGFNEAEIKNIQQMAQTAMHAATEVKTLSGVFDVAKEAAGSGWSQTWRLIFGDFEEAKSTFTELSSWINGFIQNSADARNNLLQGWKDLGGRDVLLEGLRNAGSALLGILRPIGEAFRSIFPATTSQELFSATEAFRNFTKSLIPSEKTVENLRRTFAGLFAVVGIVWELIKAGIGFIGDLLGSFQGAGGGVLSFTANIGDFLVKLHEAIKSGDVFGKVFDTLAKVIRTPIEVIKTLIQVIGNLFSKFKSGDAERAGEGISSAFEPLAALGEKLRDIWGGIGDFFASVWEKIRPVVEGIGNFLQDVVSAIGDGLSNLSFDQVLGGVGVGLFGVLVASIRKFLGNFNLGDLFGGANGFFENLGDAMGQLTDTLGAMQNALNAAALLGIAAAIGILTLSIVALAGIPAGDLYKAVGAIAVLVAQLGVAAKFFGKLKFSDVAKLTLIGGGLIALATAIRILASAVKTLADLDWNQLAKGLTGTAVLLGALAGALRLMPSKGKMVANGAGVLLIAAAIKVLASAAKDIAKLNWGEIAKGLTGVAALLTALALYSRFSRMSSIGDGAGILLMAAAIKVLASAMKDISDLNWEEIAKGLTVTAVGLGLMAAALKVLPSKNFAQAASIVLVAAALKVLASALKDMSDLDWNEIAKGLVATAGGLIAITAALRKMPAKTLLNATSLVIAAVALKIVASALEDFAKLDWSEIAKALVTLAASLLIIVIALNSLKTSISGAAALVIASAALVILANAMSKLGGMSWSDIAAALVVLAGSLLIIGIALVALSNPLFLLGAAALIIAAGALYILAGVMTTLGAMSWSDIGAAIGSLTLLFIVLAIGGALSPLILILAAALTVLAVAIGIAGVGILAAGTGINNFADAMTKLSQIDQEGLDRIVATIEELIGLLPELATAIAEAIAAFITTMAEKTPEMAKAVGDAVVAMAKEAAEKTPLVVGTFMQMLTDTLTEIGNRMPELVQAGTDTIISFLTGVAKNIGGVVAAGVAVVVSFLNAIGDSAKPIADAGFQMVIDVMNGIADSIRENAQQVKDAAANIGKAIIDGITGGVEDNQGSLMSRVGGLARSALNTMKDILGINSPSKVFRDVVGMAIPEGIAVGIDKYGYMADKATVEMGENLLATMGKTISGLGNMVGDMDDFNPVITPVLDLSEVRKGSGQIGTLLQSAPIDLSDAVSKANDASAGYLANLGVVEALTANSGVTQNFTQNNYSPKALSSADIYRQTNNQISQAKGALTNAN